jgi:hypothetical protein
LLSSHVECHLVSWLLPSRLLPGLCPWPHSPSWVWGAPALWSPSLMIPCALGLLVCVRIVFVGALTMPLLFF